MKQHALTPGSVEWHAHRAHHFNASDAPAMMGVSPHETRNQLLHRLFTGVAEDPSSFQQRIFDEGHEFEALARPLGEEMIGQELYPVVGTEGELSASFDGLTMAQDIDWEHKRLNEALRAVMVEGCTGADLHLMYQIQVEQQCMVSGAKRALFMASDWKGQELIEERHCWYEPNPELRAAIVAGWKQFAQDLAAYVPPEPVERVTAAPVETLPAVSVQMNGSLSVISNLDVFGTMLRAFVEKIPKKPTTDQEFADAAAAVKALEKAEEALDAAEANAIGQVQSVEHLTRTIATLREVSATARKATSRMVEDRKKQLRVEEVQRGKDALTKHILSLNASLGHAYMPIIPADFAAAISGKKTLDSVRNAIDTELARGKIAANEAAERVRANLKLLDTQPEHLFRDIATLVHKDGEAVQAIIAGRLAEEERRQNAERERIRQEEVDKLAREREARELKARQYDEAQARLAAQAAQPAPTPAPVATAAPAVSSQAVNVVPMGTRAPTAKPTMRLGDINNRLAPLMLSGDCLATLGFPPAATDKAAKLYHESDFENICAAVIKHVMNVVQSQLEAVSA